MLAVRVDVDLAEELVAAARRCVRSRRRLLEHELRPERVVEEIRAEAAGVQRAGDEFPERIEVLELRAIRIVVMRRAVVHVGSQPDDVADLLALDEAQDVGELELASQHRPVAVRRAFPARAALCIRAVADLQAERHVGRDDLPRRA